MHKALHPRVDIDWLNVSRKEEGRAVVSIDGSVDASLHKKEQRKTNYRDQKKTQTTQRLTEQQ